MATPSYPASGSTAQSSASASSPSAPGAPTPLRAAPKRPPRAHPLLRVPPQPAPLPERGAVGVRAAARAGGGRGVPVGPGGLRDHPDHRHVHGLPQLAPPVSPCQVPRPRPSSTSARRAGGTLTPGGGDSGGGQGAAGPFAAAFLGGGSGNCPMTARRLFPSLLRRADVVELNGEVMLVAQKFFGLVEDEVAPGLGHVVVSELEAAPMLLANRSG